MSDLKTLFIMVVVFAALAAIWWCGWFGPVTYYFMEIKRLTTH